MEAIGSALRNQIDLRTRGTSRVGVCVGGGYTKFLATTSLRGTISDAKGAVLTGATVTLNNTATGFSRTVKTDDQGGYQFLEVPPANYVMTVTMEGFATVKRDNVVLQVSSPATVNLSMRVQGSNVVVDVTGDAPVVNTQDASQGHVFGTNQLIELPSEGRDPVSILSLQPGVTFIGSNVDTSNDSRGGAVSGARSDQTNVTWDGLDNNDQLGGLAFQGALPATLDSLQDWEKLRDARVRNVSSSVTTCHERERIGSSVRLRRRYYPIYVFAQDLLRTWGTPIGALLCD